MFEELFEESGTKTSKTRLLEIIDICDFEEENGLEYFDSIVRQKHCNEEVLRALLNKNPLLFSSLDKYTIDNIGCEKIKSMDFFLLAIKKLKNNHHFMSAIKSNKKCYTTFLEQQKTEVESFNDIINQKIETLRQANALDVIISIENVQQELEEKRKELLDQYPEAKPLEISVFIKEIRLAKLRIEINAAQEEVNAIQDLCYNTDGSRSKQFTISWDSYSKAKLKCNNLSIQYKAAIKLANLPV